jgi:hypothetical protein
VAKKLTGLRGKNILLENLIYTTMFGKIITRFEK